MASMRILDSVPYGSIFRRIKLRSLVYKAVADIGGLQWFQPPLKICVCRIQLTSGQAGDTFIVTVQVKGFRRLLSTDKPIFRLRIATKVTFKLLRPFFLVSTLKRVNAFIN